MLRRPGESPEIDAKRILNALELSHEELHSLKNKEVALELLIDRLEAKQILVSRSVQNYMPQRLSHVKFSGMTIKDNKVPIVFLAGGDHGDHQEPVGRTIFSLALMTVLVAQKIFAPVTWDGTSAETDLGREYDIAGAMLMPEQQLKLTKLKNLDQIRIASDKFKVTPSAVAVRAMRLGLIDRDLANAYLDELRVEFYNRPKSSGARSPILPENAVRKYGGRELSRRMLRALDNSKLSTGEFCRVVCLKRLKPHQIDDLRKVVR